MRLVVKQSDGSVREFQFTAGPIHIGRGTDSQVFLPDTKVSRQHAVIFSMPEGNWMIEDLDSANKTYLNDKPIHKTQIKTGDCLRIADFSIEIDFEAEADKPSHLEDTLITAPRKPQVIARNLDAEHAPDIKFPAKRAKDFLRATEAICKAGGPDAVLKTLLTIIFRQFDAHHAWCALRNEPEGPMTSHAGKARDGKTIGLNDIKLYGKITQAVEKGQFLLFPKVSSQSKEQGVLSAMIAPVMDPTGCFGVLYMDNAEDHRPYNLSDLDYLMLLAIHTAAILENF
ncbi:MAG: FHA domain-containing protein [Planctomycetes bacterium]|nr:FHA domain-containing protein [Planctomycetota bacterium]